MKPGHFIILEGIDGSGTTTQARRLAQRLSPAIYTNEPTDGEIGRMIRRALSSEDPLRLHPREIALLFAADRHVHSRQMADILNQGITVVCDRYALSSWVYQGIELPLEWVKGLSDPLLQPDLTILLDIDPEIAAGRRAKRGGTKEIFEEDDVQRNLAVRYRELVREWPDIVCRIDGSAHADEVADRVWSAVHETLGITA